MKRHKKELILVGFLFLVLLFSVLEYSITENLATQQLAKRWSKEEIYTQLACYFTEDGSFTKEQILAVERSLITGMEEASITAEKENGGRNWLDAYSTQGELVIASNRAVLTVRAFGVGGDFFKFHPLTLLDGTYFDNTDFNEDGVVIDEVTAWQLFGSNHVAGMEVEINGTVYPIRGVVRSDNGLFSEAVKEEEATIYVSFGILEGEEMLPIDCYEVLIANPVEGFGKETFINALDMEEDEYEIIECSTRYDLANQWDVIQNFGVRSMTTKNIVFPYWENRARGYEDVSALLLVMQIICLVYPVWWLLKNGYSFWKNRKEVKKKFWENLKNKYTLLKNKKKTDKVNKEKA